MKTPDSPDVTKLPDAPSGVSCSDLLEALRRWRYFEKRHALIVLGELGGDRESAERAYIRALHELRIVADRVIASNDRTELSARVTPTAHNNPKI